MQVIIKRVGMADLSFTYEDAPNIGKDADRSATGSVAQAAGDGKDCAEAEDNAEVGHGL